MSWTRVVFLCCWFCCIFQPRRVEHLLVYTAVWFRVHRGIHVSAQEQVNSHKLFSPKHKIVQGCHETERTKCNKVPNIKGSLKRTVWFYIYVYFAEICKGMLFIIFNLILRPLIWKDHIINLTFFVDLIRLCWISGITLFAKSIINGIVFSAEILENKIMCAHQL